MTVLRGDCHDRSSSLFRVLEFLRDFLVRFSLCEFFPEDRIALDEDITTSDTIIPSIELQGSIMRSQAQQLRRQLNSFLYSSANDLENRLLSNDLIVIRDHK
jgi:hypothetical protein